MELLSYLKEPNHAVLPYKSLPLSFNYGTLLAYFSVLHAFFLALFVRKQSPLYILSMTRLLDPRCIIAHDKAQ